MTKCWECKTEVSTRAKTCPKCGARRPGDMKAQVVISDIAKFLMGLGLILMAGNCLLGGFCVV